MDYTDGYLQGQFLVAAPAIQDERFEKTVLYIFHHDKKGASALIINKPSQHIDFEELCDQLNIDSQNINHVLYDGGPVEGNRGYVLHTDDFSGRDTEVVEGTGLSVTTTVDVIKRVAEGKGPERVLMALGYAAWGPGQLEEELTRHGWLHATADKDIIFDIPHGRRWETVIKRLGINFGALAEYTGTA